MESSVKETAEDEWREYGVREPEPCECGVRDHGANDDDEEE